jgi:hypothetical protein
MYHSKELHIFFHSWDAKWMYSLAMYSTVHGCMYAPLRIDAAVARRRRALPILSALHLQAIFHATTHALHRLLPGLARVKCFCIIYIYIHMYRVDPIPQLTRPRGHGVSWRWVLQLKPSSKKSHLLMYSTIKVRNGIQATPQGRRL